MKSLLPGRSGICRKGDAPDNKEVPYVSECFCKTFIFMEKKVSPSIKIYMKEHEVGRNHKKERYTWQIVNSVRDCLLWERNIIFNFFSCTATIKTSISNQRKIFCLLQFAIINTKQFKVQNCVNLLFKKIPVFGSQRLCLDDDLLISQEHEKNRWETGQSFEIGGGGGGRRNFT